MKKLLLILLLPALLQAQQKWITGHVTAWDLNMGTGAKNYGNTPYKELDYDGMTHLIMFNITMNSSGRIDSAAAWDGQHLYSSVLYQSQAGFYNNYIHTQRSGKPILICVWPSVNALATATLRTTMTRSIMDFIRKHKYDGLDVDCETGDSSLWPTWWQEMSDSIRATPAYYDVTKKMMFTADMAWSRTYGYTQWAASHQFFDQINIMSYDNMGSWQKVAWHTCAAYTGPNDKFGPGYELPSMANAGRELANAGIPRSKIGIGFSVNGYSWTGGVTNYGSTAYGPRDRLTTYPSRNPWNETRYYAIKHDWVPSNTVLYDNIAKAPYISTAGTYYTFTDTTTAWYAAKIVKDSSFGGLMVWEANGQYLNSSMFPSEKNRNPMLRAIKNVGIDGKVGPRTKYR